MVSKPSIKKRLITRNFIKGRTKSRNPEGTVKFFVPHTYNGKGSDLYNWFQENNIGVSAHYAVDLAGVIYQYIEDSDEGNALAHNWADANSISIEFADNGKPGDEVRTDALYASGAKLIAYLMNKHMKGHYVEFPHNIKLHKEFTSTGCPGNLDYLRLQREANAILKQEYAKEKPEKPESSQTGEASGSVRNSSTMLNIDWNSLFEILRRFFTVRRD